MQTNFFSAEFGNTGGTVINMISKSGTNELHGVGYYYRRDAAMNANQLFFERATTARWPIRTATGWAERWADRCICRSCTTGRTGRSSSSTPTITATWSATTTTASVPTAQQLTGDFSDTRLANGNLVPIYNPYSLTTNASGARVADADSGQHHSGFDAEPNHAEIHQILSRRRPPLGTRSRMRTISSRRAAGRRRITRSTPRSITTFPTGSVSARGTALTGPTAASPTCTTTLHTTPTPGPPARRISSWTTRGRRTRAPSLRRAPACCG